MGENKKFLKIVLSVCENESRDMRELSVVKGLGARIIILAKGEKSGESDTINGFETLRMSTRPFGERTPKMLNRIASIFTWAVQARKIQPDVISGHDLIALYIGWISTWFVKKERRAKLVYDSHEFTIYSGNKRKFQQIVTKFFERFIIKKCALVIEVNDQIAEEVQKIHKLKEKPVVVRNIPEKWVIDSEVCAATREKILEEFSGGGSKGYFILMYHGAIMPGRGIETLIEIIEKNPFVAGVILGNGEKEYIQNLKEKAERMENKRIYFHNAVKQNELWKFIGAVDLGMILAPATCKNHLYSLPNKFFENIQSETPIVCPDYPSMKTLVDKYEVGLTCNPENVVQLIESIDKLRKDKELYERCKKKVKIAKEELSWNRESIILKEAYAKLL